MSNVLIGTPRGSNNRKDWERFVDQFWLSMSGEPTYGQPVRYTQWDGPTAANILSSTDTVNGIGAHLLSGDDTHQIEVRDNGNHITGDAFTEDLTIVGLVDHTGNTVQTGDVNLTGDFDQTGNMTVDGLLHILQAVDFDSTLNVDGAATLQTTLHLIGALTADGPGTLGDAAGDAWLFKGTNTFNEDSTFKKALIVEGNTTLGNAAGDTITGTGTATFAEDFTLSKRLLVTGAIVNDTTLLVTDPTNNKVGIGVAPISTSAMVEAAGAVMITNSTGTSTTSMGLELRYAGGTTAEIRAIDRATVAFKNLDIYCLAGTLRTGGTKRVEWNGTGIGFFGTAPVAQRSDPGGTIDATYGATEQAILEALVATMLAYGLWA